MLAKGVRVWLKIASGDLARWSHCLTEPELSELSDRAV